MNAAARRARQKSRNENGHDHQNRAARTFEDAAGITQVQRCLFCQPVAHENEKTQQHGMLSYRPTVGKLLWGKGAKASG